MIECQPMQNFSVFRLTRRMVFAVLFLYGLALGVATAAPMINAGNGKGLTMLCTNTGIKFVNASGKIVDGKPMMQSLDCSFCMPTAITPDLPPHDVVPIVHTLAYATQSIPAARLAAIVSAPLPPRGPPALIAI